MKAVFDKAKNTITVDLELLPHQKKAYYSKEDIAGICGGRGLGKSYYLSAEAMMSLIAGEKVLIFGLNYKTLTLTLFTQITKRFEEFRESLKQIGYGNLADQIQVKVNKGECSIKYGKGEIYGLTYENIEAARGFTEVNKLLLDELALAPSNLMETVAPCLRGCKNGSKIRFGTTPRSRSFWNRWFLDDKIKKEIFRGTSRDNTKLEEKDFALFENSISDERMYRQEVLGEILEDDIDFGVISVKDFPTTKKPEFGRRKLGIDFAGSGADNNVFIISDDNVILEKRKVQVADTFQLYSIAKDLIYKYNVKTVNLDGTGGWSNGVYDMLKNLSNIEVNSVNFQQKAIKDCYANARAEMYMEMVKKIREGFFIDDEEIREELTATTYLINNSGKTQLVPKDEIKAVLGRSPDTTDALALSLYEINEVQLVSKQEAHKISISFASL